ncbi:MAG: CHAT domain-containing protein [Acidimicrobiia bacterium]|nr:CHAT domain-containing protein [Acidimicrobiia bacterium]
MVAEAAELEREAASGDEPEAVTYAMWARGHALRELGRMANSTEVLHDAIQRADGDLAERIRTSLALTTFLSGDTEGALEQSERAIEGMGNPTHRARAQAQKGLILARVGRLEEALTILDEVDEDACDETTRAQMLGNRGITAALLGRFEPAERDLERTRKMAHVLGQTTNEARARHNLAFVASLKGDLVRAISEYRQVAELVATTSFSSAEVESDLAEVLLGLGLVDDAAETARRSALRFTQDGRAADAAEANLLLARSLFTGMHLAEAAVMADTASQQFADQQRPGWKQAADAVRAWCRWAGDTTTNEADLDDAVALASELYDAGWIQASYRTILMVGRSAIRQGNTTAAERILTGAKPIPENQPPSVRTMWFHIEGLRCQIRGDTAEALSRFDDGIAVVHRFRNTLGATELRTLAASLSQDLAEDGLRLAAARANEHLAMEWIERDRAASIWHPPTRPPEDSRAVQILAQLRQVTAELNTARLEGTPHDELVIQRRELEDKAASAMWSLDSQSAALTPPIPEAKVVEKRLGGRALVMFGSHSGRLISVTQNGREKTITDHGDLALIATEIGHVSMSLRRLAAPGSTPRGTEDLRRAADYGLEQLDAHITRLLPPVDDDTGLVVMATDPLHRLPLSLLPGWRGKPITMAPSLALWARPTTTGESNSREVYVSGPGLTHGEAEVTELSELARSRGDREVVELKGNAATVEAVTEMMDGAYLIHIAAHGRFSEEHPSFSSIELVDGGLTIHDLAGLGAAPRHVVLSACDAGIHAVTGRDLIGIGATFLGAGTRSLIASLAPLPDDLARDVMRAYRTGVATGSTRAEALANAVTEMTETHPLGFLSASLTLMGSI